MWESKPVHQSYGYSPTEPGPSLDSGIEMERCQEQDEPDAGAVPWLQPDAQRPERAPLREETTRDLKERMRQQRNERRITTELLLAKEERIAELQVMVAELESRNQHLEGSQTGLGGCRSEAATAAQLDSRHSHSQNTSSISSGSASIAQGLLELLREERAELAAERRRVTELSERLAANEVERQRLEGRLGELQEHNWLQLGRARACETCSGEANPPPSSEEGDRHSLVPPCDNQDFLSPWDSVSQVGGVRVGIAPQRPFSEPVRRMERTLSCPSLIQAPSLYHASLGLPRQPVEP